MNDEINEYLDTTTVGNLKVLFKDKLLNMANKYFDDFEKNQIKINALINEKKYNEVAKIAHGLKGNSLNMGAKKLAACCMSLEEKINDEDNNKIIVEFNNLQKTLPIAKEKYISYIRQL